MNKNQYHYKSRLPDEVEYNSVDTLVVDPAVDKIVVETLWPTDVLVLPLVGTLDVVSIIGGPVCVIICFETLLLTPVEIIGVDGIPAEMLEGDDRCDTLDVSAGGIDGVENFVGCDCWEGVGCNPADTLGVGPAVDVTVLPFSDTLGVVFIKGGAVNVIICFETLLLTPVDIIGVDGIPEEMLEGDDSCDTVVVPTGSPITVESFVGCDCWNGVECNPADTLGVDPAVDVTVLPFPGTPGVVSIKGGAVKVIICFETLLLTPVDIIGVDGIPDEMLEGDDPWDWVDVPAGNRVDVECFVGCDWGDGVYCNPADTLGVDPAVAEIVVETCLPTGVPVLPSPGTLGVVSIIGGAVCVIICFEKPLVTPDVIIGVDGIPTDMLERGDRGETVDVPTGRPLGVEIFVGCDCWDGVDCNPDDTLGVDPAVAEIVVETCLPTDVPVLPSPGTLGVVSIKGDVVSVIIGFDTLLLTPVDITGVDGIPADMLEGDDRCDGVDVPTGRPVTVECFVGCDCWDGVDCNPDDTLGVDPAVAEIVVETCGPTDVPVLPFPGTLGVVSIIGDAVCVIIGFDTLLLTPVDITGVDGIPADMLEGDDRCDGVDVPTGSPLGVENFVGCDCWDGVDCNPDDTLGVDPAVAEIVVETCLPTDVPVLPSPGTLGVVSIKGDVVSVIIGFDTLLLTPVDITGVDGIPADMLEGDDRCDGVDVPTGRPVTVECFVGCDCWDGVDCNPDDTLGVDPAVAEIVVETCSTIDEPVPTFPGTLGVVSIIGDAVCVIICFEKPLVTPVDIIGVDGIPADMLEGDDRCDGVDVPTGNPVTVECFVGCDCGDGVDWNPVDTLGVDPAVAEIVVETCSTTDDPVPTFPGTLGVVSIIGGAVCVIICFEKPLVTPDVIIGVDGIPADTLEGDDRCDGVDVPTGSPLGVEIFVGCVCWDGVDCNPADTLGVDPAVAEIVVETCLPTDVPVLPSPGTLGVVSIIGDVVCVIIGFDTLLLTPVDITGVDGIPADMLEGDDRCDGVDVPTGNPVTVECFVGCVCWDGVDCNPDDTLGVDPAVAEIVVETCSTIDDPVPTFPGTLGVVSIICGAVCVIICFEKPLVTPVDIIGVDGIPADMLEGDDRCDGVDVSTRSPVTVECFVGCDCWDGVDCNPDDTLGVDPAVAEIVVETCSTIDDPVPTFPGTLGVVSIIGDAVCVIICFEKPLVTPVDIIGVDGIPADMLEGDDRCDGVDVPTGSPVTVECFVGCDCGDGVDWNPVDTLGVDPAVAEIVVETCSTTDDPVPTFPGTLGVVSIIGGAVCVIICFEKPLVTPDVIIGVDGIPADTLEGDDRCDGVDVPTGSPLGVEIFVGCVCWDGVDCNPADTLGVDPAVAEIVVETCLPTDVPVLPSPGTLGVVSIIGDVVCVIIGFDTLLLTPVDITGVDGIPADMLEGDDRCDGVDVPTGNPVTVECFVGCDCWDGVDCNPDDTLGVDPAVAEIVVETCSTIDDPVPIFPGTLGVVSIICGAVCVIICFEKPLVTPVDIIGVDGIPADMLEGDDRCDGVDVPTRSPVTVECFVGCDCWDGVDWNPADTLGVDPAVAEIVVETSLPTDVPVVPSPGTLGVVSIIGDVVCVIIGFDTLLLIPVDITGVDGIPADMLEGDDRCDGVDVPTGCPLGVENFVGCDCWDGVDCNPADTLGVDPAVAEIVVKTCLPTDVPVVPSPGILGVVSIIGGAVRVIICSETPVDIIGVEGIPAEMLEGDDSWDRVDVPTGDPVTVECFVGCDSWDVVECNPADTLGVDPAVAKIVVETRWPTDVPVLPTLGVSSVPDGAVDWSFVDCRCWVSVE